MPTTLTPEKTDRLWNNAIAAGSLNLTSQQVIAMIAACALNGR